MICILSTTLVKSCFHLLPLLFLILPFLFSLPGPAKDQKSFSCQRLQTLRTLIKEASSTASVALPRINIRRLPTETVEERLPSHCKTERRCLIAIFSHLLLKFSEPSPCLFCSNDNHKKKTRQYDRQHVSFGKITLPKSRNKKKIKGFKGMSDPNESSGRE